MRRSPARLAALGALLVSRLGALLVSGLGALLVSGLCASPPGATAQENRPGWVGVPKEREPSQADRTRVARAKLESGRALMREGKPELAEAALRRGLSFAPDHPGLLRELARALEALGRPEAAARERARADALEPPLPALPGAPLGVASEGVLVVLLSPAPGTDRVPRAWPEGEVAGTLEGRLRVRLPEARVVHATFESVGAARDWLAQRRARSVLSLRVDRIYCGNTVKDGRFGMSRLRGAAGSPERAHPLAARAVVHEPRLAVGCRAEATGRALEELLARPELRERLAAARSEQGWTTASIRTLFPGLGERIDATLEEGETLLSQGRIDAAAQTFRRAARIDGEDPAVRTYLREAEATLALSRELSERQGERGDDSGNLDPRFTRAQLAALEASLIEERRLRAELLATLAVMDEDARLPAAEILSGLRPAAVSDPSGFGPTLARNRAGGQVEARAAYAPDGAVIAVYYFPAGDPLPVLREEDLNQDGLSDRWIAYAGDTRSEIWEAGRDSGRPDVRLVFAGQGRRLARIEIDRDADGRPERVFRYARGVVTAEARDTNGDGNLDTFDRLDTGGNVVVREEDLDGDGRIDSLSHYEEGRLVRRELAEADGT